MIGSIRINLRYPLLIAILLYFFVIVASHEGGTQLLVDNGLYFLMGIFGAIAANGTGSGGGVVFIPVFSFLNLNHNEAVATSLAIQCIGMSIGATVWTRYVLSRLHAKHPHYTVFPLYVYLFTYSFLLARSSC